VLDRVESLVESVGLSRCAVSPTGSLVVNGDVGIALCGAGHDFSASIVPLSGGTGV
jgi:hypothetical protein